MSQTVNYQPTGSINVSNVRAFQQELMTVVNSCDSSTILLDLKYVDFLDSAGLMALVTAYKTAQSQGKRFCIRSVSPSVRIIFELSQLDKVFEILEEESLRQKDLTHSLAA